MSDVPSRLQTREYSHSLKFAIEERSPELARGRMPIADGMLTVTLNAQLLGNRRSGDLIAEARPVRRGKRLIVVRTEVKDADGALLLDVTTTHIPA